MKHLFPQLKADKGEGQAPELNYKSCRTPGKVEIPAPANILCQDHVLGENDVRP